MWVVLRRRCNRRFRSLLLMPIEYQKPARETREERGDLLKVRDVQLSNREIQKTLDFLRKRQVMGQQEGAKVLSAEEIEGIQKIVKKLDEVPPIRQDRVEKVRRAFESSSYNVTCDDVAKELIGRVISDKLI